MTNIALFDEKEIRVTEDRKFSVYDVLEAFLPPTDFKASSKGKINPRQILKSIVDNNSEVVHLLDKFKFPGRGQRETPVATEESIYQILMLCPGKRASEFRKWAAQILANPDKAVNHAVFKWKKQGRSNEWIEQRLKGIHQRHKFTDTLKEHGVTKPFQYAVCTNKIYEPLLGGTAKEIKEERGLVDIREGLSDVELMAVGLAEALASRKMREEKLKGFKPCREACEDSGSRVSRVFV